MKKFNLKPEFRDMFQQLKDKQVLRLIMPFFLMDAFVRLWAIRISYLHPFGIIPSIVFSAIWVLLIIFISQNLRGNIGRAVYSACLAVFFAIYVIHSIYYPYTGFFFSFHLVANADEGAAYIWDTVKNTGFLTISSCVLVLVSGISAIVKYPKVEKSCPRRILLVVVSFIIIHALTPFLYGRSNSDLEWDSWRNPRNVYKNFSDSNKSVKISGIYEYTFRDLCITLFRSSVDPSGEEIEFLEESYQTTAEHNLNDYTGIFEGKNVIFVQMEGIDSWLLTKEDMPTLHGMKKNAIVFDNHYSFYTGGGSTFNSELAAVTGFLTPFSFKENPYAFHKNEFPHSLPRMFKQRGYSANAFHMNTGEYYSREINYLNWGFDNYYSLMENGGYDHGDESYFLDRNLIENEFFYSKMFGNDGPFLHYIITYTTHKPFTLTDETGELLFKALYGEDAEIPEMGEEEIARLFAGETDRMFQLLLEALKENGLYENTVIVAYTDHYLYTMSDKTILDRYKDTENNHINRTPFMIWSADLEGKRVSKVNSQVDILPTVLNMFGFEYNDNSYVGQDIMNSDYEGYVFFSDYSWITDGHYIEEGVCITHPGEKNETIDRLNEEINTLIARNDSTLKFDYFRTAEKSDDEQRKRDGS